jgi:hypothetical protein
MRAQNSLNIEPTLCSHNEGICKNGGDKLNTNQETILKVHWRLFNSGTYCLAYTIPLGKRIFVHRGDCNTQYWGKQ